MFIPLLTPMPCHLPSQFLTILCEWDSIRVSLSLLLLQCESSFSPTHTHVTWGWYDQAPSIKPPYFPCFEELSLQDHTKEGRFHHIGENIYSLEPVLTRV